MVLEENKQYHFVNKFIVDFITQLSLSDDAVKNFLLEEWKRTGSPKLKSILHKNLSSYPKRIVSKYLYFCDDERPKIKAEHPEGINIKDVTRELGKRWRAFQANPDAERMARYTELFETDKKRYDEARSIIKPPIQSVKKKSSSPYINFCTKQRLDKPKISIKELSIEWAKIKSDPIEFAKYTV